MRRLLLLIALLLILPAAAQAQSDDLSALTGSFDQLVPSLLEQNGIVGASLALIHDGVPVWSQGYGVSDEAAQIPVTADTVFSVESISKSVTAWEIMRLVEAGQIDLDTPVNQVLQGWHVPAVGRNDPDQVTVRRILSHTAGLSVDGYRGYNTDTTDLPTLTDLLDGRASGVQPVRVIISPGAHMMYSGGGYEILQLLIEQITGESYSDRIQADLFDNLGMDHSYPNWSAQIGDQLATSYTAAGAVDSSLLHADLAAGGLFTSADDLARFFTEGMSADWLTPESVALLHTPADGTDGEYGFASFLFSLDDGTPVVWHDGIGVGQRSIFFLLPDSSGSTADGLIILTNSGKGNVIFHDVVCVWDAWLHDGDQTKLCGRY